jgi:hypothetical protein
LRRTPGHLDIAKKLSPEWQPAALAGKGELDEVEECFDRQVLPNREASFRMPDMPADILLQPEPNPTQVRDIVQNVRVSRGLLQTSPVKGKPIGNSMIEVQLDIIPLRQLIDELIEELLLLGQSFCRRCSGQFDPRTESRRQRRLAYNGEATDAARYDRHPRHDPRSPRNLQGPPGATCHRVQPPWLLKEAI